MLPQLLPTTNLIRHPPGGNQLPSTIIVPVNPELGMWDIAFPRPAPPWFGIRHPLCKKPAPTVLHVSLPYRGRYLCAVPWRAVLQVGVEIVGYAVTVPQALDVYGNATEQLHHAVHDEPAAEAGVVRVDAVQPGCGFVLEKCFREVTCCAQC